MINNTVAILSVSAAVISAFTALLSFIFSRKLSRRDMVDTIKIDILDLVTHQQGQKAWIATNIKNFGNLRTSQIVDLLVENDPKNARKYRKDKWKRLITVSIEELKTHERFKEFLKT